MIPMEVRMLLSRVLDPRDRAQLQAHAMLEHQEDGAAERGAHYRWQREVDALARSIDQRGQLGLAADGGLLSERRARRQAGSR